MPPRRRRHKRTVNPSAHSLPKRGSERRVRLEQVTSSIELALWPPGPHRGHWLSSCQAGEGGRGQASRVGTPAAPSSGAACAHAHAHTRPTRACTPSPLSSPAEAWSPPPTASPQPDRERTPHVRAVEAPGQAGLRAPDAPAPPPPAVSMGSLARCHSVPLLAPLPIKKTLGTGRRESPGESPGQ